MFFEGVIFPGLNVSSAVQCVVMQGPPKIWTKHSNGPIRSRGVDSKIPAPTETQCLNVYLQPHYGNGVFGNAYLSAALQMFCMLFLQSYVCQPNPQATLSNFNSLNPVIKKRQFNAVFTVFQKGFLHVFVCDF